MKTVLLASAAAITLGLSSAHAESPTFPNTFFNELPGVIAKPATGSATATAQTPYGQPVQLYPALVQFVVCRIVGDYREV